MDETQNSGNWDAWGQAVLGTAISVAIDRVTQRPQLGSDPSQAYGIDDNGRIYQLGKTNAQISARVEQQRDTGIAGLPSWLVIGGLILLIVESK